LEGYGCRAYLEGIGVRITQRSGANTTGWGQTQLSGVKHN